MARRRLARLSNISSTPPICIDVVDLSAKGPTYMDNSETKSELCSRVARPKEPKLAIELDGDSGRFFARDVILGRNVCSTFGCPRRGRKLRTLLSTTSAFCTS